MLVAAERGGRMSPETSARLMRSSIDYATAPALYRARRMTRRERKATFRVLWLVAFGLAYFAWRTIA